MVALYDNAECNDAHIYLGAARIKHFRSKIKACSAINKLGIIEYLL
jgi:hypothetical protein